MKRILLAPLIILLSSPVQANFFAPRKYTYSTDIQAGSYETAYKICKIEVQLALEKSLANQKKYNIALYHSDKYEAKELIKADCTMAGVADHLYNKKMRLKPGDICVVSDNNLFRIQKLIPDENSVGDPDWNKPRITSTVPMSAVTYPCKK